MKMKRDSLEQALISRLADMLGWVVSLRWEVEKVPLSEDECEAHGVPAGHTVPAVFSSPLAGGSWWRFAIYDQGDSVDIRVLGWSVEVHYVRSLERQKR